MRWRKLLVSVCSFIVILSVCSTSLVQAGTAPSQLSSSTLMVAKQLWVYMVSNGYSEQAAAGVLGNADQESNFTVALQSGNYYGTFQFSSDLTQEYKKWAAKQGVLVDDIVSQFMFVETRLVKDLVTYTKTTLDEFKSTTDVARATDLFCAAFERCVCGTNFQNCRNHNATTCGQFNGKWYQQLNVRRNYAKEFYTMFTGSIELSEGTSTSETVTGLSGWLSESTFVDTSKIVEDAIYLPAFKDLSQEDKTAVSDWVNMVQSSKDDDKITAARVVVVLVGIVVMLYSVLLYLSYWFDRINNFVEINLLQILTLGRLMVSPDDRYSSFHMKTDGAKAVTHKDISVVCLMGIALGVLILSGKLYVLILKLVTFVRLKLMG